MHTEHLFKHSHIIEWTLLGILYTIPRHFSLESMIMRLESLGSLPVPRGTDIGNRLGIDQELKELSAELSQFHNSPTLFPSFDSD